MATDLQGNGYTIGVWEAVGLIRNTHDELAGRVTLADTGSFSDHATHVAGILAGAGVLFRVGTSTSSPNVAGSPFSLFLLAIPLSSRRDKPGGTTSM